MIRKTRWVIGIAFIVLCPVFVLYLLLVSLNWHPYGSFAPTAISNAIASSLVQMPADEVRSVVPTLCKESSPKSDKTWADCLNPTVAVPGDCEPFLLERCETLSLTAAILSIPSVLIKVIDALRHPCDYLTEINQLAYGKALDVLSGRTPRANNPTWGEYNYKTCIDTHKYAWRTVLKLNDDNNRRDVIKIQVLSEELNERKEN